MSGGLDVQAGQLALTTVSCSPAASRHTQGRHAISWLTLLRSNAVNLPYMPPFRSSLAFDCIAYPLLPVRRYLDATSMTGLPISSAGLHAEAPNYLSVLCFSPLF